MVQKSIKGIFIKTLYKWYSISQDELLMFCSLPPNITIRLAPGGQLSPIP